MASYSDKYSHRIVSGKREDRRHDSCIPNAKEMAKISRELDKANFQLVLEELLHNTQAYTA